LKITQKPQLTSITKLPDNPQDVTEEAAELVIVVSVVGVVVGGGVVGGVVVLSGAVVGGGGVEDWLVMVIDIEEVLA
jgi:hypothetical protein